jgi:hypothetical protein
MMFDVPVRLNGVAANLAWVRIAIDQFDRVVVVATLALVVGMWWRVTGTEPNLARANTTGGAGRRGPRLV